jgi:AAA ATPase domain
MAPALGSAYVTTMWPIDRPPQWVDRSQELATLRAGVEALRRGEGAAVWVEGEPGIGKSSLVAEALTGAGEPGWDIGWGMADQLAERLPLSVMRDCLQVRPGSPDPRRAHAADLLRSQRLGLFSDGDASVSGCEVLMALERSNLFVVPLDDRRGTGIRGIWPGQRPAASCTGR